MICSFYNNLCKNTPSVFFLKSEHQGAIAERRYFGLRERPNVVWKKIRNY
ncbi:MAG: hypothetical protein U5L45_10985 [Saprospiraceae bacterium]|nr:hypothetical protein [Saprospiraceae bacterium]